LKILQSFWSYKFLEFKNSKSFRDWPSIEYEIYGRSLSCLLLSRLYKNIELVTDIKGKELLIDILKLPYTNVVLDLNILDKYSPELWMLDDIYSMGIQDEPFMYVDDDVFFWSPLPEELTYYNAFTLYKKNYSYSYTAKHIGVEPQFVKLTPYLFRSMELRTFIQPHGNDFGIIGGCNNLFFREYSNATFFLLEKYTPFLNTVKYINELNFVLSENLFYNTCRNTKVVPFSYFSEYDDLEQKQNLFSGRKNAGFHHFNQYHKKNQHELNELEFIIRNEFPDYYYRIQKILKEKIVI
jgi:hypothetical protein